MSVFFPTGLFKKNARRISDSKREFWTSDIPSETILTVEKECLLQSLVVRFPFGPDVKTRLTDSRIIFSIKGASGALNEYRATFPIQSGEPDTTAALNPFVVQFDNLFEYMGGNDDTGHFIGLKKTLHLKGFAIRFETSDDETRDDVAIVTQWAEFDE